MVVAASVAFELFDLFAGIGDKESSLTPPLSYSKQKEDLCEISTAARSEKKLTARRPVSPFFLTSRQYCHYGLIARL